MTSTSDDTRWLQRIAASQPDPEMDYAARESFQLVSGEIEKILPAFRQALTLTYYDEMSGAEARALLGISSAAFKARLSRARRQLLRRARRALDVPFRKRNPSDFSHREPVQNG